MVNAFTMTRSTITTPPLSQLIWIRCLGAVECALKCAVGEVSTLMAPSLLVSVVSRLKAHTNVYYEGGGTGE